MDNGPGWLPDPEHEDQERYWNGDDWTDRVRPADPAGTLHLPEHVPELQRALAAATADIDEVEDRLSSLFDRTGNPAGAGAVRRAPAPPPAPAPAPAPAPPAEATHDTGTRLHEEFETVAGGAGDAGDEDGDDEDDAFAELDAALAAETPDKPDRRFFRRRS